MDSIIRKGNTFEITEGPLGTVFIHGKDAETFTKLFEDIGGTYVHATGGRRTWVFTPKSVEEFIPFIEEKMATRAKNITRFDSTKMGIRSASRFLDSDERETTSLQAIDGIVQAPQLGDVAVYYDSEGIPFQRDIVVAIFRDGGKILRTHTKNIDNVDTYIILNGLRWIVPNYLPYDVSIKFIRPHELNDYDGRIPSDIEALLDKFTT